MTVGACRSQLAHFTLQQAQQHVKLSALIKVKGACKLRWHQIYAAWADDWLAARDVHPASQAHAPSLLLGTFRSRTGAPWGLCAWPFLQDVQTGMSAIHGCTAVAGSKKNDHRGTGHKV